MDSTGSQRNTSPSEQIGLKGLKKKMTKHALLLFFYDVDVCFVFAVVLFSRLAILIV